MFIQCSSKHWNGSFFFILFNANSIVIIINRSTIIIIIFKVFSSKRFQKEEVVSSCCNWAMVKVFTQPTLSAFLWLMWLEDFDLTAACAFWNFKTVHWRPYPLLFWTFQTVFIVRKGVWGEAHICTEIVVVIQEDNLFVWYFKGSI